MKYSALTYKSTSEMNAEEIRLGVEIGAQIKYENRVRRQMYQDWSDATSRVRTDSNRYPKDEEIRPVAICIYQARIDAEVSCDCQVAAREIVSCGGDPTEELVLLAALKICRERTQRLADQDWFLAEDEAKHNRTVWFAV